MSAQVKKQLEEKMSRTIEALKTEFTTIRAGRANAQMLDKIRVCLLYTSDAADDLRLV